MGNPLIVHTLEDAANWIDAQCGDFLSIATPLGLGKPNQLLNEVYRRVKENPNRRLKIFTALSLQVPHASGDIERRFLEPFRKRFFGDDYPELQYAIDGDHGRIPENIEIHEFYFQAGKNIRRNSMQHNYISLNYTHVAQAVWEHQVQALVCLIAKNPKTGKTYSLACNPDLTLDVADLYRSHGKRLKMIGVVHPTLPFIGEDAEVDPNFFDVVVESPEVAHQLFALPREPVSPSEFMIGFQASLLIEDGGTIQVGIGSLSDALIYSAILRQKHPQVYRKLAQQLIDTRFKESKNLFELHVTPFREGLYGTSEMVMDAFMHLRNADILIREINDSDVSIRRYLHGAFFLGSKEFYQWMRERYEAGDSGLCMTRVSKVNDLYDPHELALRRQRKKARFFNMCMQGTLLGGAASDSLENGQVVSGVGGQFNFVTMSHELPDSHSVILFRSFRKDGDKKVSNVVWGHEQTTIPRHLRDIMVTEYGIGFLRAQSDEQVIRSMIEIADSGFQENLRLMAIQNGKLSEAYHLPERCALHTSEYIEEILVPFRREGWFPTFPFGSDFTPTEQRLVFALGKLKQALPQKSKLLALLFKGLTTELSPYLGELERMELSHPKGMAEWTYQKLLLGALGQR